MTFKKSFIENFNFRFVLLPITFKIHSTWFQNDTVNNQVIENTNIQAMIHLGTLDNFIQRQ